MRLLLGVIACAVLSSVVPAQKKARKFTDPVERKLQGWTIAVDPALLAERHQRLFERAFGALENHLQRITYVVPKQQLAELRKLRIWVELDNPRIRGMQYHPGRRWLVGKDLDPRLVKHVHVPQAVELIDPRMWRKHPYVILHELAHAYHDQVLGFDHAGIRAAYQAAKKGGKYEKVLLFTGKRVRHYALTDHKEYFAEATEAWFGVNDFYPFVRAELREHDPRAFALLSEIWGRRPAPDRGRD